MAVTNKIEPKRSREANKAYRRQQLIDATIDCIYKLGFADTTLAKVAERANLSQGIVIFHFKSKDQLFTEALRFLAEEYTGAWHRAIEKAGDGASTIEKICALVSADFEASICNRKKIAVWFAFWGETKAHPTYQEIAGERNLKRGELLVQFCREMSEAGEAPAMGPDYVAGIIDGLSDGHWQKMYLGKDFGRKEALDSMFMLLLELFPRHKEVILKCKK